MSNWTADDGTTIHYEVYGSDLQKDVLLLLPGLMGSINRQWVNFVPALTDNFRLVLMDLRGHGRSSNNAPLLETGRMVQDIVGLLDELQATAVHVAGYNLGGYLGLQMLLTAPRRVHTLLMHASKFYWTADAAAKLRAQLDPDDLAAKVPTYADQLVQDHGGRQWRILVRQAADLISSLVDNGLKESMIKRIQTPVLVSVGDRDELIPLNEAQRLSRMLPNGRLLVLPGVRHPYQTIPAVPLIPMMQEFHRTGRR
ncbi:MAG: alpha/beta hydrolase [Ardenticatenaceae bacterium]|nr:alpha/beta hydrolase [Ardenticatenaceae bacterium]MCB8987425.1 alpha/beta hydrolase [Ardenticatenaceae bacterium]